MLEKFIEENLEKDIKNFETNEVLFERYKKFCKFYGFEIMTKRKFSFRMNNQNVGVKHIRMKNYNTEIGRWGVKLLPCKY